MVPQWCESVRVFGFLGGIGDDAHWARERGSKKKVVEESSESVGKVESGKKE